MMRVATKVAVVVYLFTFLLVSPSTSFSNPLSPRFITSGVDKSSVHPYLGRWRLRSVNSAGLSSSWIAVITETTFTLGFNEYLKKCETVARLNFSGVNVVLTTTSTNCKGDFVGDVDEGVFSVESGLLYFKSVTHNKTWVFSRAEPAPTPLIDEKPELKVETARAPERKPKAKNHASPDKKNRPGADMTRPGKSVLANKLKPVAIAGKQVAMVYSNCLIYTEGEFRGNIDFRVTGDGVASKKGIQEITKKMRVRFADDNKVFDVLGYGERASSLDLTFFADQVDLDKAPEKIEVFWLEGKDVLKHLAEFSCPKESRFIAAPPASEPQIPATVINLILQEGNIPGAKPNFKWGEVTGGEVYALALKDLARGSVTSETITAKQACKGGGVCAMMWPYSLGDGMYDWSMRATVGENNVFSSTIKFTIGDGKLRIGYHGSPKMDKPPKPKSKLEKTSAAQPVQSPAGQIAALAAGGTFMMMLGIGVLISLISVWKVHTKAGQPGWSALIPIYNIYIMEKIAGKPGWWALLWLVPLVQIVVMFLTFIAVAKNFGKSALFGVGLIFLPIIFFPILAFGSAQYQAQAS